MTGPGHAREWPSCDDPRGQGGQKPGDLLHGDQHGVVSIPHEIAPKIPDGVAKVESAERRIIGACQAADFSAEKLKALYREARPGTY